MGIDIDPRNTTTGLVLGLGLSVEPSYTTTPKKQVNTAKYDHHQKLDQGHLRHHQFGNCKLLISNHHQVHEPISLTLSLSGGDDHPQTAAAVVTRVDHHDSDFSIKKKMISATARFNNNDQISGDVSGASSLSNVSVKREREVIVMSSTTEDVVEMEKVISSSKVVSDEDDDGTNGTRKKLRLTKAQSALLEESFKHHSTLNPKQKQDLARDLKLRPRQVEVWFQNRRARTKLKQTEVDCEVMKKYCETLTEENRRLQKELQELKAKLTAQPPLYMQLPAATLTMCPSCERIGSGGGEVAGGGAKTKSPLTTMVTLNNKPQPPHFYNPFMTNPSSAC